MVDLTSLQWWKPCGLWQCPPIQISDSAGRAGKLTLFIQNWKKMIFIAYDLQFNWFWVIPPNRDARRVLTVWKENHDRGEELPIPYLPHCLLKMQWEIKIISLFVSLLIFTWKQSKYKPSEILKVTERKGEIKVWKWKLLSPTKKTKDDSQTIPVLDVPTLMLTPLWGCRHLDSPTCPALSLLCHSRAH